MKYPLPKYHFIVEWGRQRTDFIEVTGLDINFDEIEYRSGSSPTQNASKMPGLVKYSNIILKRGIVEHDVDFFNWIKTTNNSSVEKRDVVIQLLNGSHEPVMTWKVRGAFPVKYSGPQFNALSSEVAIETLELAHEGLTVE